MLIILGGLPGVGKTTLAKGVSTQLGACYVRIDSIEQAIKHSLLKIDDVIDAGYAVGYAVAKDNLRAGKIVVADSVNSIEITRKSWRDVAKAAGCAFIEVEVICSDQTEHEKRIKTRNADIPGHKLPDWPQVITREYESWNAGMVIDTAGKSVDEVLREVLGRLGY